MCLIIDTNTFGVVLDKKNMQYACIRELFGTQGVKLTIGGTDYRREIEKMVKYSKYLRLLKDAGKVVEANRDDVDERSKIIKAKFNVPSFNDPHIVALAAVSHARLVVTEDRPLMGYLGKKELFDKRARRPSIYTKRSGRVDTSGEVFRKKCLLCK